MRRRELTLLRFSTTDNGACGARFNVANLLISHLRAALDARTVMILDDSYVRGFLITREDKIYEMLCDEASRFVRFAPDVRPLFMGMWSGFFSGLESMNGSLLLLVLFLQAFPVRLAAKLVNGGWLDGAAFLRLFMLYTGSVSHAVFDTMGQNVHEEIGNVIAHKDDTCVDPELRLRAKLCLRW